MANLSEGIQNNSNQAVDKKYLNHASNPPVPYVSVAEACTLIIAAYRHIGLTVRIGTPTVSEEYHFKAGILDSDLVIKAAVVTVDAAPVENGTNAISSNWAYNTAQTLQSILSIIGPEAGDGDSVVNTVRDLLSVFQTYTEGVDLATQLSNKVNTTDVVNTLTEITAGKVLDARQGKVLKDLIDTINTALPNKASTADVGDKTQLETTDKTSLVAAINELKNTGGVVGAPDGILSGLEVTIDGYDVEVSAGEWRINNIVYSKATITEFTLTVADVTNSRYDLIRADATGIFLDQGTTAQNAQEPDLPANNVEVKMIYITPSGISTAGGNLASYVTQTVFASTVGDKSNLQTSGKNNLVEAINELDTDISSIETDNITLRIFKVSNYATL